MSYQKIVITGNLGRDPEMRYTPSGQAVTSFSVAVNESYTNANGEKVKKTIWFRVTAWGKQAEICNQYLKKGQQVLVDGRMSADPNTGGPKIWTKQDGTAGSSFEITAQTVRFLSSRADGDSGPMVGGGGGMEGAEMPPEDDIPF
ncbi:MAG: single-stranded DNA-binding protein [Anaerolineales bacterium]|jgi:single-strand DNA-binding protein|nr:single-stranded DNA-binding protein [Anaerolineales bacterium]